jgi:peroxiredoxin
VSQLTNLVTKEQAETDALDFVEQINALQAELVGLNAEQQAALIAYRDGRYQTLVAEAKLKAVRATIDITKARLIALQAMLKAVPR